MPIPTAVRQNPIKSALSSASALAILLGLFYLVDDRYAHAGQFQQFQQQQTAQITKLRKSFLEDQLFELDFLTSQRGLSPLEHAKKERIERELNKLEKSN